MRELRLVGDNVEPGIYPIDKARQIAADQELDLVVISDKAEPFIARILEYKKFLYEQKKKQKELKAKQVKVVVKEIRFGPQTDDHDYEFKKLLTKKNGQKISALEIQEEFIEILKQNRLQKGFKNVEIVKGTEQNPNLPANSIDLAIMVDVYHELAYPQEMLWALAKALKPDGKILLLEYRAEDPEIAIKELHKMSVKQVSKEMEANGFKLYKREDFLPIQHFLVYEKK